ncbi:MAG: O-antigen ligase family protein [Gemmataceae bacterium]
MSEPSTVPEPKNPLVTWKFVLGLGLGLCFVVVGTVYIHRLPIIVGLVVALAVGVVMLRWPNVTTVLALGLLYSNLAVVAVKVHGAPGILPAAVLGMFAWPLFYHIAMRRENVRLLSASPFLLLFVIVQLVGALLARDPIQSCESFVSFLLEGVALYFIITNVVRTRQLAVWSFWSLALCAILMGGAPLLHQIAGNPESNLGGLAQVDSQFKTAEDAVAGIVRQGRAAGTIGEQNRYAQFMILLAPISFALVFLARTTGLFVVAVAATLLALAGFALAFSRGAAVGLGFAFLIGVWLKLIPKNQVKFALIGVALVPLVFPQYLTRLASLGSLASVVGAGSAGMDQADGAIRGRVTEMWGAVLTFRDHPLAGVGPGMFGRYSQEYGQIIGLRSLAEGRQAHSMPLDIAAEHGLIGLFAMVGVFVAVFRSLFQARSMAQEQNDRVGIQLTTGMLLVVVLYLTTGLFLHLSYIRYFWLLIGLADAIGYVVQHEDHNSSQISQPEC